MSPEAQNPAAPNPTPAPAGPPTPPPVATDAATTPVVPDPTAAATPASPVAPVESAAPVAPVAPVEPIASAVPAAPTAPVAPEPVAPIAPVAPETPVAPVAPEAPTAPDLSSATSALDQIANELSTADASGMSFDSPVTTQALGDAPVDPTANPVAPVAPEAPAVTAAPVDTLGTATPETPSADTTTGEQEAEEPAIQPAQPVPGSIGSALAYSDASPDHAVKVEKPKKKMDKKTLILIIVLSVVLVAGIAVGIIMLASANNSNNNNNNSPVTYTGPVESDISLVCNKTLSTDKLAAYANAKSGTVKYVVDYSGDELEKISATKTITFNSAEEAEAAVEGVNTSYQALLSAANLEEDPFESKVLTSTLKLTETHSATKTKLSKAGVFSGDIFELGTTKAGKPIMDLDSVKETYEGLEFSCTENDREEEPTEKPTTSDDPAIDDNNDKSSSGEDQTKEVEEVVEQ